MKKIVYITIILWFVGLLLIYKANAETVTLIWNPVAEADGYKIYYGTASRVYSAPIDTGDLTNGSVELGPGTYYFAVTAYNAYGESGYSDEVSTVIDAICSPDPPLILCQPEIRMFNVSGLSLTVQWDAVAGVDGYRVYLNNAYTDSTVCNWQSPVITDTSVLYIVSVVNGVESDDEIKYTLIPYVTALAIIKM